MTPASVSNVKPPLDAGQLLHEAREAARAVAAHLAGAAVAVIEVPGPIRLARSRRHQQEDAIRPHAAMPVAEPHDLVAGKPDLSCPVINEHKVIPRAVHLGEIQNHWAKD